MNKARNASAFLMSIAAVCFGIASYSNFSSGETVSGIIALLAAACSVIAAVFNLVTIRRTRR